MRPKGLTWGQIPNAPHVCLWSPQVVPRTPDWDDNIRIAGYAYPSTSEINDYKPPKALEDFLEAQTDKPVVVFGFGSMTIPRPDRLLSAISGALKKVGARAVVILPGRPTKYCIDATANCSSSGIFVTDEVPHAWLLPRSQGFIHHGGAGHTAAGLHHGVPMLLTPFFLDQNFWAARLHQMQLSPAPFLFRELTEERLATALSEMLASGTGDEYRQRCRAIAKGIALDDDGAEIAASTISHELDKKGGARCSLVPNLGAEWCHVASGLPLCGVAAATLEARGVVDWSDLRPLGPRSSQQTTMAGPPGVLSIITALLGFFWRIFSFFHIPIGQRKGAGSGKSNGHTPVSLAIIRKNQFDLGILRDYELARGNDVETQLVRVWQSAVGSRFRAGFDQDGTRMI